MRIEQLTPDRVEELWPQLEPVFLEACQSNEISKDDITPEDIRILLAAGQATSFASFDDKGLATVIVLQFHTVMGTKGVDVISMGGRRLLRSADHFWEMIKDWLRANDVKFIDAYASPRLARIYLNRLGFTKSCTYVRTML